MTASIRMHAERAISHIANKLRLVGHHDGRRDEIGAWREVHYCSLGRRRLATRAHASVPVGDGLVDGGSVVLYAPF